MTDLAVGCLIGQELKLLLVGWLAGWLTAPKAFSSRNNSLLESSVEVTTLTLIISAFILQISLYISVRMYVWQLPLTPTLWSTVTLHGYVNARTNNATEHSSAINHIPTDRHTSVQTIRKSISISTKINALKRTLAFNAVAPAAAFSLSSLWQCQWPFNTKNRWQTALEPPDLVTRFSLLLPPRPHWYD